MTNDSYPNSAPDPQNLAQQARPAGDHGGEHHGAKKDQQ
jgi:hypothetical protein